MLSLTNQNERQLVKTFVKFLLIHNAYDRFIYAINRKGHNLLRILQTDPPNLINTPISWSGTREGWTYWASLSNEWKNVLERKFSYAFLPSDRWERDGDHELLNSLEVRHFDIT